MFYLNSLKEMCIQVEVELSDARARLSVLEAEENKARMWAELASGDVLRLTNAVNGLNVAIANLTSDKNEGNKI